MQTYLEIKKLISELFFKKIYIVLILKLIIIIIIFMKKFSQVLICLALYFASTSLIAAPRFSIIPLVFQNDINIKQGYLSATVSGSQLNGYGIYDANQTYVPSPMFFTNSVNLTANYGLTDDWDLLLLLNYAQNDSSLKRFDHIGDTSFTLGYALFNQDNNKYHSSSRIEFSLLIPSGKFNALNPSLDTTDATGGGSYQPAIGFSFNTNINLKNGRTVNVYGYAGGTYALSVKLNGLSAYGGSSTTEGFIRPGNSFNFSIGSTYMATDKLSLSMSYDIFAQQPANFKGKVADNLEEFIAERRAQYISTGGTSGRERIILNKVLPTFRNIGGNNFIGSGSVTVFSVSPTISYNVLDDVTVSFTMSASVPGGKNATGFYSPILSLTKTYSPS